MDKKNIEKHNEELMKKEQDIYAKTYSNLTKYIMRNITKYSKDFDTDEESVTRVTAVALNMVLQNISAYFEALNEKEESKTVKATIEEKGDK